MFAIFENNEKYQEKKLATNIKMAKTRRYPEWESILHAYCRQVADWGNGLQIGEVSCDAAVVVLNKQ